MNRKGELTTQQIVGLIILIASFAIILILIFRLDLRETTNKEICHNSVILKSKSLVGGELDCRTSYVCISGGGECEGINPTETVEIDMKGTEEEIKNRTMKSIADEMADCWWMFGEGKVDYVDKGLGYNCAICSIVKFDSLIYNNKNLAIDYQKFYEYLEKEQKDSTQTYLKYFYGVFDVNSFKEEIQKQSGINVGSDPILFNERFSIVTGSLYNLGAKNDKFLPVYFVRSDAIVTQLDTSIFSEQINCKSFDITKA